MSDVWSFKDCTGAYTFTAKIKFKKKCYQPEDYDVYNLNTLFNMSQYLHNPVGPAIIKPNGEVEYWMDGVNLTFCDKDAANVIENYYKFNDKLLDIIND